MNIYTQAITHTHTLIYLQLIDLVGRMLANGSGVLDSIPGRVIPKT